MRINNYLKNLICIFVLYCIAYIYYVHIENLVWVTYIGEKFSSICPSCNLREITVHHFHIGYVISKHDGGTCTLD